MIFRCQICKELILPPPAVAIVGSDNSPFLNLLASCTRHAAEKHQELFAKISAIAGQVIASLALELFEAQDPELKKFAGELRSITVTAVNQTGFSAVSGTFELRESENINQ